MKRKQIYFLITAVEFLFIIFFVLMIYKNVVPVTEEAPTSAPTEAVMNGDAWLKYSSNGGIGGCTHHIAIVGTKSEREKFNYYILSPESASDFGIKTSREGYSFQCWNTKPDGTGQNYYPHQKLTMDELGGLFRESYTLYAIWEKNE